MKKYATLSLLFITSSCMYTMEELVLAKKTKKDDHRTPQDLNWPTIPKNCSLHTLDFRNFNLVKLEGFSRAIPQHIDKNAIKTLILSGNRLSNIYTDALNGLKNLEQLDLSDNEITFFRNSSLHKLKILDLSHNKITSWNWDKYVTIKHTNLSGNPVDTITLTMPEHNNQAEFLFQAGEYPELNISDTNFANNPEKMEALCNALNRRIPRSTEATLKSWIKINTKVSAAIGGGIPVITGPFSLLIPGLSKGNMLTWIYSGPLTGMIILGCAAFGISYLAGAVYYKKQMNQDELAAQEITLHNIITDKEGHVAIDMSDSNDISGAFSDS